MSVGVRLQHFLSAGPGAHHDGWFPQARVTLQATPRIGESVEYRGRTYTVTWVCWSVDNQETTVRVK